MTVTQFLSNVYSLFGKSYESVDCIGVIRKALNINCEGSNWLFRSIKNYSKYRYLVERHACGDGTTPPPGAVTFKTDETKTPDGYETGPDAYHCGVVDTDGYVIHSSPKTGVRKDLTSRWTEWDYWGLMKQVDYGNSEILDCGVGGDVSDPVLDRSESGIEAMTDRELLEAIYHAVVRD